MTVEQVLKDCTSFTRIAGWEWEITWYRNEWVVSKINGNEIRYHGDDFAQALTVYRELEIVNEPIQDDSEDEEIRELSPKAQMIISFMGLYGRLSN